MTVQLQFLFHTRPITGYFLPGPKITSFEKKRSHLRIYREKLAALGTEREKDGSLAKERRRGRRKKRVVLVRFNKGFGGFNGGGGGGGGRDNSRLIGNIALAVGLTYLSMTGQIGKVFDAIGWIFDALFSIWLIAVIVPIVGFGALLWWAQRDVVQSNCPNCGSEFQIFKSTLNDKPQLCPYCGQPFSVVDGKFVSDPATFSNQSTSRRTPSGFPRVSREDSSSPVVDIEAEVKDAE